MNLGYAQKKKKTKKQKNKKKTNKQTNKQSGKGMFEAKWMWAKRGDL